jgi:hypothetical protein
MPVSTSLVLVIMDLNYLFFFFVNKSYKSMSLPLYLASHRRPGSVPSSKCYTAVSDIFTQVIT